MAIPPTFYWAHGFSEGVGIVEQMVDGATKYGYIDKAGKTIAEPVCESVAPFSGGLGLVDRLVDGVHVWSYLDATGKVVWSNKP